MASAPCLARMASCLVHFSEIGILFGARSPGAPDGDVHGSSTRGHNNNNNNAGLQDNFARERLQCEGTAVTAGQVKVSDT